MHLSPDSAHLGSWRAWCDDAPPLRLGVSSCLLGQQVRYDGGHKRDDFVVDLLGRYATFVDVCPEVELGMGTPRPSVRLVLPEPGSTAAGEDAGPRMVDERGGVDWTDRMRAFATARSDALASADLDGYVLKKASPSCGLERLRVFRANGHAAHREGRGLFAAALVERLPDLPVEEEGRLNDPRLCETFVERVFTRARWRRLRTGEPGAADLVAFHTAHKLLLLAHDEPTYRALGRVVARAGDGPLDEVLDEYGTLLHRAVARPASTGRHVNVLQHVLGHFKDRLPPPEKAALLEALAEFEAGLVPLAVPATLLRFQVERWDVPWLRQQLYLDPYPKDLQVRNQI